MKLLPLGVLIGLLSAFPSFAHGTAIADAAVLEQIPDSFARDAIELQVREAEQILERLSAGGVEIEPATLEQIERSIHDARRLAKKPGIGKRIARAILAGSGAVARGVGYAGNAVFDAYFVPLATGIGFGIGLINGVPESATGDLSENQRIAGGAAGGVPMAVSYLYGLSLIPGSVAVSFFLPGLIASEINFLICGERENFRSEKTANYCRNIRAMNETLLEDTIEAGSRFGVKMRHVILFPFKRKFGARI